MKIMFKKLWRVFFNLFGREDRAPTIFVILLSLFLSRDLFGEGYFRMHDGLVPIRQMAMEKCLRDGQLPCRWSMDMGGGFGYPIFNYYPPFPYFFGEVFRLFGFSLSDTVKLNFVATGVLAGVFMYFLGREFFGRAGGLISASFYLLAPYRAVDLFVRGALNESWAFVWFPLIFFSSEKTLKNKSKLWILLLGISWAGLLLSHSLMSLIFFPLWLICFIVSMKKLIMGFFWGLGLSAFFVMPAILEKNLVVFDMTTGYFNFRDHFATVWQMLLSRFWGYGQSFAGSSDTMAFPVGQVHWILTTAILLAVILKRKKLLLTFVIIYGWLAIFMSSAISLGIWEKLPFLKYVQFPWRFLSLSAFSFSFASGYIAQLSGKKVAKTAVAFTIILLVFVSNYSFFRAQMVTLGGVDITKSEFWNGISMVSINDYLPKTVINFPNSRSGFDSLKFNTDYKDNTKVTMDLFYFPGWKAYIDNKETDIVVDNTGRINLNIPSGVHDVSLKLTNTPVRTTGNVISLSALILVFGYFLRKVL